MVKLVDVANEAGVSAATVSRVLNDIPTVDPAMAKRVRAAAKKLGYRPNAVARSLRKRRTQIWQLVVSDIANPFYTALARGVEDVAVANGYHVVLGNSKDDVAREARYLELAQQEQVAGVIIAPQRRNDSVTALLASGIPVVAVNQTVEARIDHVLADSHGGAREATRYLLTQGWERPACITGPTTSETAQHRARGYREVMVEAGLSPVIEFRAYQTQAGADGAAALLDSDTPPDAFFACNAMISLGVLKTLKDRGLRAGQDVGLVAFDDAPWSELTDPSITVIAQHPYEMGIQAARLLLERIRDDDDRSPVRLTLQTDLIERESGLRRR
ncbi:LacI family DNA-binding transcriptional regulator [Pedococcus sp. 2YAF34]|uniref:LacI family DNA-binding transcriptional regulator n=1 Tax=Pedococcus sp. 2YAF34 TaxID=3233032 RepID=UPI003F999FB5